MFLPHEVQEPSPDLMLYATELPKQRSPCERLPDSIVTEALMDTTGNFGDADSFIGLAKLELYRGNLYLCEMYLRLKGGSGSAARMDYNVYLTRSHLTAATTTNWTTLISGYGSGVAGTLASGRWPVTCSLHVPPPHWGATVAVWLLT
ncbi:hypothetical protein J6590_020297 [Homalodisca vitripennis]|nr:hypothetical protein J6590_020297 [Homalodisca vitripennis]